MFNNGSTALKHYKRLGIYKNSTGTVQFNPTTLEGYSYNWNFVGKIGSHVVLNDYSWSPTTSCHQGTVRRLLWELGIKYVSVDLGDSSIQSLSKSRIESRYRDLVNSKLSNELKRKQDSWKSRIVESDLNSLNILMESVPSLRLSQKTIKTIYKEETEKIFADLFIKQGEKIIKRQLIKESLENNESIEIKF